MRNGRWITSNPYDLVPKEVFAERVREHFRRRLQKIRPKIYARINPSVWQQTWKVYTQRYEIKDRKILLEYLSKFVFRVAITRNQLLEMDDNTVTYRYQDRETGVYKTETLDGVEFLLKFAQHVLPRRFHKTRKAGLYHYDCKDDYDKAVAILREKYAAELAEPATKAESDTQGAREVRTRLRQSRKQCQQCGSLNLHVIREFRYGELVTANAGAVGHAGHVGYAGQIVNATPFQVRHGP